MKLLTELFEGAELLVEGSGESKKMYIHGIHAQANKVNRNRRNYPKPVMEQAIDKYNTDFVLKNRALGELSHPCFTADAKVFVEGKGLIPIADVKEGDYVYGTDLNNVTSPVKVLRTTKNMFTGNLINFDSRSFRATVTPYHRFYTKEPRKNNGFEVYTAQEIKDSLAGKGISLRHNVIPITMENWVGVDEEFIKFSPTQIRVQTHDFEYANEPLTLKYKDFCAFMGIYLSEGCIGYTTREDGTKVYGEIHISQNVGTNLDLIIDLISGMGFNKTNVRISKNGRANVIISDIRMADYVGQFGDCYAKYVPDEVLMTTKENISEFLTWFNLGDGSHHSVTVGDSAYTRSDVFTVSEKMADGLIECILKTGRSTTKRIQVSSKDYIFADHLIKIKNKSPLYRMSFGTSQGKYIDSRFMTVTEQPHDDFVYCLVTETGNFYVEQHGTCFLTGNCRMSVDPALASHRICELTWDGDNVIGKSLILNTPQGNIIRGLLEGGTQIGVSTRGAGTISLREGVSHVGNDFTLATIDAVLDPSAHDAWVDPLMESADWICESGVWKMQQIDEAQKQIKQARSPEIPRITMQLWEKFVSDMQRLK